MRGLKVLGGRTALHPQLYDWNIFLSAIETKIGNRYHLNSFNNQDIYSILKACKVQP